MTAQLRYSLHCTIIYVTLWQCSFGTATLYNIIHYTLTVQLRYSYTVQYYIVKFDSGASVQLHCTIFITGSMTAQLQYSYTVQYYKRWTLTAKLSVQAMLYLTSISGWLPEMAIYIQLHGTWNYAVQWTTQYMLLHGIYNYTVQVRTVHGTMPHLRLYTTTQYRRLHGTWNYAVHGTTQYMGLRSTADYTVQVRKVHGTMPHRDSAIQCINDYAWISYPGQVNNWCNVEVRVKSYFYLVLLIQAEQ
jgi:hypothetical protein